MQSVHCRVNESWTMVGKPQVSAAFSARAVPRSVSLLQRSCWFLCRSVAAHLLPDKGAETFGTTIRIACPHHPSCLSRMHGDLRFF
jgi:hypothetical protein